MKEKTLAAPGGHPVRLYLASEGRANSASGDGKLRPMKALWPSADEFVDDPTTDFPNYERNLHTGGHNYDESAARPARIDILHDAQHPSFVEFTTMPR